MHGSVMGWLAERATLLPRLDQARVLEVGSYDENGSAREIFEGRCLEYWGIDARDGRGVDEVSAAAAITNSDGYYDLVICTEMLEHDPTPWLSLPEMARVLASGGSLLMTARGFDEYQGCYGRHDCPKDYWRFNVQSFEVLIEWAGLRSVQVIPDPEVPGVFGHAVKP
jgi:hypothetical protein